MIRSYQTKDKGHLMALLRANTPRYFHVSEEKDYKVFLDQHVQDYFVAEKNNQIVGAGGVNYFPETKSARLSWDLVAPEWQGKGIGRELTLHRIRWVREKPGIETIEVRTTQHAFQFYEKIGFALQQTAQDYWAPGFDLYWMRMENL